MAWPLALMAAGMAMQAAGQLRANADQAEAERANAQFFKEQAEFQRDATDRELKLFKSKAIASIGNTIGAYAKGGVLLSASAFEVLGGQVDKAIDEENAIIREGRFRERLARLRGAQSESVAASLTSSDAKFMIIGGTAAQFAGASGYGSGGSGEGGKVTGGPANRK